MCERGSYVCSSDRATGVACRGQGAEADGVSEHRQLLVPGGHVDGDVEGAGGEQGGDDDHDREVEGRQAAAASVPGRVRDGDRGLEDRKSVVKGKSVSGRVDLGGRRNIKKKNKRKKK